jgi:hypothetical protein
MMDRPRPPNISRGSAENASTPSGSSLIPIAGENRLRPQLNFPRAGSESGNLGKKIVIFPATVFS